MFTIESTISKIIFYWVSVILLPKSVFTIESPLSFFRKSVSIECTFCFQNQCLVLSVLSVILSLDSDDVSVVSQSRPGSRRPRPRNRFGDRHAETPSRREIARSLSPGRRLYGVARRIDPDSPRWTDRRPGTDKEGGESGVRRRKVDPRSWTRHTPRGGEDDLSGVWGKSKGTPRVPAGHVG